MRFNLQFDEKTQRWAIVEEPAMSSREDIGELHRSAPEFQAFPALQDDGDGIGGRARHLSIAALSKLSVWREFRTAY